MSWTIDASDWTRQLSSPFYDGNFTNSLRPSAQTAVAMSLSLTTAGRLGFFIDYSERETVGTHTFYVTRTHGSQGAVGCTWTAYDSADGAQLATGTLSWNDLALDILSFEVNVPSKPAGDHRIYVLLSNPTGGAVLHHGDHTVAYGIIDDDTITTSNAIFIDADAATNGTGTQASPYNNWYSARGAVLTTTRFIYIKGMLVPDGTDIGAGGTDPNIKYFNITTEFTGRTSENQRLVIRNWPLFTGGLAGGGATDVSGFFCGLNSGFNYITFKGLTIDGLNTSTLSSSIGRCFFLWVNGAHNYITVESSSFSNIVSGANAATGVWYTDGGVREGYKLWNCSFDNITHSNVDKKMHALECYRLKNTSIQKCTISQTAGGFYQKTGVDEVDRVGFSCRFNYMDGAHIRLSTLSSTWIQDYHIVQCNIFDSPRSVTGYTPVMMDSGNTNAVSVGQYISNNTFYNYNNNTSGDVSVLDVGFEKAVYYNNIHVESKRPWRYLSPATVAEYMNFNCFYNNAIPAPIFNYIENQDSLSLATVRGVYGFEIDSVTTNPMLENPDLDDFTLQTGSPALTGGISGTQQGAYLGDFYAIGAN